MSRQKTLPDSLQSLSLSYIDISQPQTQSEEKYCHRPMIIYYDHETSDEFSSDCVSPCEKELRYQDDPNVEVRPRWMTTAICCAQRDMRWCLMCAFCCYTPALLIDCTYLMYSCCAFPIKKYSKRKKNQLDNQEYARFFPTDTQNLRKNLNFFSQQIPDELPGVPQME